MNPLEIGLGKRIALVFLATLFCLLTAGVVFGYAALKPVLVDAGVYRNLCDENEVMCDKQLFQLDFMFTVAAVATNVSALLIGIILDRFGPRVTAVIGSVLFFCGCIGFAGSSAMEVDAYIWSFGLLAVGGPFIFMATLNLTSVFPTHSGLIMALLTGAFDASSIVFLGFAQLYWVDSVVFDVGVLFLAFSLVPLCALVYSVTLIPKSSFTRIDDVADDSVSTYSRNDETIGLLDDKPTQSDSFQIARIAPLKQLQLKGVFSQLKSYAFILLTIFMCFFMLRLNFFIATIEDQLKHTGNISDEQRQFLLHLFNLLLPLGGAIAVLPVGWILDCLQLHITFLILLFSISTFGVLTMISNYITQFAAIVVFVIIRPMFYSAASEFAARIFGFKTFGKVYGLMAFISGLFNFTQTFLIDAVRMRFNHNFLPVNIGLTVIILVFGALFPLYLTYQYKLESNIDLFDIEDDLPLQESNEERNQEDLPTHQQQQQGFTHKRRLSNWFANIGFSRRNSRTSSSYTADDVIHATETYIREITN